MLQRNEKEQHRAIETPSDVQLSIRPLADGLLEASDAVVVAAYGVTHSRKGRLRRK
jgi:hypothetical protein